jgi:pimeloyl-ACP methyl ester carboxylesterase
MQRPVMNPMFLDGIGLPRPRRSILSRLIAPFKFTIRLLLADIAFWRHEKLVMEEGSALIRLLHGMIYRMLLIPVCLILLVAALVYIPTHPQKTSMTSDPQAVGAYYDPIKLVSSDGIPLEAWLVPLLDARLILEQHEKALRAKQPAVVLVHDYGCGRGQMLPLINPLHDAGYVVLVLGLRSSSGGPSAFGLKEAKDIQAALEMLRRRPGIDGNRIAVLGIGTGATAAMLAAERDKGVAALILDHPPAGVEEILDEYLGPRQPWLKSLRPLCKWAFELAYRVDADDLELQRHDKSLAARPLLMFNSPTTDASLRGYSQSQIRFFLEKSMPPTPTTPVAASMDAK